ncbi:MAG: thiolase family protein [Hyphomicrobiales bacterium]|nr:thiolase family protein [Hyphomicrobiales bacterium]MCP5370292.1 thiolase family protein [Hyphomicrobiales bacterium]
MSTGVYVIGAASTDFGPQPDIGVHDLAADAAWRAIESSGLDPDRIEIAFAGHAYQGPCLGQKALMKFGLTGLPIVNVENACASGATAVQGVINAIRAGQAEVGLALGAEKLTKPGGGFLPIVTDDLDSTMGRVMPAAFAMIAQRHMYRYGTTREQMARVAVKNRGNALRNPRCHLHEALTVAQVMDSPVIADPMTRYSCCPVSDGAAAVVLAGEEVARRVCDHPVEVAASVLVSGLRTPHGIVDDRSEMSARAAGLAYAQAGIKPADVDVCELHDPFTIAEIVHYEDLGFCAPGEGGAFVQSGRADIGGDVAVSPSGGLLAKGHPLGATGVAQIAELFWQLRGEAGGTQVPGARVGLAHTVGGGVSQLESGACAVHVLRA